MHYWSQQPHHHGCILTEHAGHYSAHTCCSSVCDALTADAGLPAARALAAAISCSSLMLAADAAVMVSRSCASHSAAGGRARGCDKHAALVQHPTCSSSKRQPSRKRTGSPNFLLVLCLVLISCSGSSSAL